MAFGTSTLSDAAGGLQSIGAGVSDMFAGAAIDKKIEGLQFEEKNYGLASDLALQNEQYVKTSTAIQQQQQDRELYQSLGKTEAAVGNAGLAKSGSSLDLLRTSAQQGATTRAAIGQQGLITEAGYQEQSDAYKNMVGATEAAIAGLREAQDADKTSSMLNFASGGLKLASSFGSLFTGSGGIGSLFGGAAAAGGESAAGGEALAAGLLLL